MEIHFQVNYYSQLLLTSLVLKTLAKAKVSTVRE